MKLRAWGLNGFSIVMIFLTGGFLYTSCAPQVLTPSASTEDDDGDDSERYADERTGECAEDKKCKKLCNDIFNSRKARDKCEAYSIAAVEKMNAVFEVLESPNKDKLEDLDKDRLKMLLSISPDPLEKAVGRISPTEKKKFLAWLAEDSEAAEVIESAEDDFSIMKKLFGSSQSAIADELKKTVDKGDNFVELLLKENNESALEWLHDFFGNQCDDNSNYEKCVFKHYCALSLDTDSEEAYFDYDFFKSLLDEILENERQTSPPSWWEENMDAEDLEKWKSSPHNVCLNQKPA